jgi:hypothetical protein
MNDFFSWFTFISCIIGGIYIKYKIDTKRLKKVCELFEDICDNNPSIIDYLTMFPIFEKIQDKDKDKYIDQENNDYNSSENYKLETKYENKYNEKYLQKFKDMPNECNFTEEEMITMNNLKISLKEELIAKYKKELNDNTDALTEIQLIIAAGGLNSQEGVGLLLHYFNLYEDFNEDPDNIDLEECWNDLLIEKGLKEITLQQLNQMTETYDKTDEQIHEDAYNSVLKNHLLKHKNNYVLEYTPLGNVYMRYSPEKETFEYFSDSTLPYRYLETVARKYVITFFCKPIYIDIEEELKRSTELQKENNIGNSKQPAKPTKETLEIMNKIKSKNTKISLPPQVQANLPSIQNPNSDKVVLKERANRYTWEGRLRDFCPLKKIDKKVVDKRLNISFAEFKKMMIQNKK